jgi:hypothetical protein
MNIFEENKMNSIETGRITIESGTLLNDKGEEIATCGRCTIGSPLDIREVRAIKTCYWDNKLIEQGTITKIKYGGGSYRDSWELLINGIYIPFYKDDLMKYFEAINP